MSYVTVTLKNLNHGWAGDVDVLLVGPSGQTLRLMENACSGQTINSNLTFSDNAPFMLPPSGAVISGTLPSVGLRTSYDVSGTCARGAVWHEPGGFQRGGSQRNMVVVCNGWRRGRLRQPDWWMGAGYFDGRLRANSYSHRNTDPIANAYSNGDSDSDSDRNTHTNTDTNGDSQRHRDA